MKFLRVDMSREAARFEEVGQPYLGLGGRGLTSTIINAEVPPRADPLGLENKLIFAPGILSGTSLVNTSRTSVGAKSPLTGTIKESNAGGTISAALGRLGIAAIVIEGQVKASRNTQIAMAGLDCIGLCILATAALAAPEAREALVKALSAKLSTPFGPDAIPQLGIRTLQAEGEFNRKAGFTNKDDRLPEFFYKEALPPHNTVLAVTDEELDSTFAF